MRLKGEPLDGAVSPLARCVTVAARVATFYRFRAMPILGSWRNAVSFLRKRSIVSSGTIYRFFLSLIGDICGLSDKITLCFHNAKVMRIFIYYGT
jgi:hypothetical protein